ncbi:dUTP diphosphatase [Candidatus Pacearchaeota archaeon]|nr:dUTP diphosphatase [Candidatus Pacearchaeota archaeon]
MQKILIKIKKLYGEVQIPKHGNEHAAGFDLYSCEDKELQPGEHAMIATGIALEIPDGKVMFIWDRSGIGSKGIHRFAGVIDSDYRGEIKIILCNHTKNNFKINKGDRIAQAVIQDYYYAEFLEVDELSESSRGEKGFGSSGK